MSTRVARRKERDIDPRAQRYFARVIGIIGIAPPRVVRVAGEVAFAIEEQRGHAALEQLLDHVECRGRLAAAGSAEERDMALDLVE